MVNEAVDRAIRELPLLTRAQVMEEALHDPGFWTYFAPLALSRSPGRAVNDSMAKSLINEINPKEFPETARQWPRLREHFRWIMGLIRREASVVQTGMGNFGYLGQGEDIWSSIAKIVSSVGSAATNVYLQTLNAKLIKARQEAEARAQSQQLQQIQAQAQAAAAAATGVLPKVPGAPEVTGVPTPATEFPSWIIYALLAAAVIGGAFILLKRGG